MYNEETEYKRLSSSINRDTNNKMKEKLLKITKQKNSKNFSTKRFQLQIGQGQNAQIYKSIKLKVTESQIDGVI